MERLTYTDKPMLKPWVHSADAIKRLAAYEDTDLEPEEVTDMLAAHRTVIRQITRTVVLPCKVGDIVYLTFNDHVAEAEVTCIRPFVFKDRTEFRGNAVWRVEDPFYNDGRILDQDMFIVFGKDAYLTREEAEAALEAKKDQL